MKAYIVQANTRTKKLSKVIFPLIFEMETGKRVKYENLERNANGKPLPVDGIHFNISHSGSYWCIIFSDTECGVDIEVKRRLRARLARKILFPSENLIEGDLINNWVIKEAYAKMISVGIGMDFKSINIEHISQQYVISDISEDDYACYAIGAGSITQVVKLHWDGIKFN